MGLFDDEASIYSQPKDSPFRKMIENHRELKAKVDALSARVHGLSDTDNIDQMADKIMEGLKLETLVDYVDAAPSATAQEG